MLSPGEWHRRVPKEKGENLRFRRWLLKRGRQNRRVREAWREACKHDLLFYINSFVWQYNPQHLDREVGPFITWPFQDEAFRQILRCVHERRDLVIEKSREMGATWMCLLAFEWLWHFHPRKQFLAVSRSAEAVDSASENSLFSKLDFVHDHQPHWLMDPAERERTKMFFGHRKTHSIITGEASTGRAGVGGRATAIFVDEFTQIKEDFEVLYRTADTSRCRIFNFTHTGTGTAGYQLTLRENIKKLRLMWWEHPDKNRGLYQYDAESHQVQVKDPTYEYGPDFNFVQDGKLRSPWYDEECQRRQSPRAIAMDLDCNPLGSVSQFFDEEAVRRLVRDHCVPPFWEGQLAYDPDDGRPCELVKREGGPLKLWCNLSARGLPPPEAYGAGCDIAAGTGATPSCLGMINSRTGEKVLEYADPFIDPKSFASLVVALCRLFRSADEEGALLAWELQGPGVTFGDRVIALGYRHVYYRTYEHSLNKKTTDSPGWNVTPDNKRTLLEEYHDALRSRACVNRSESALRQCLHFRYTPRGEIEHGMIDSRDDPTGARVNHGDQVIADALAWMMARKLAGPRVGGRQKEEVKAGSLAWRRGLVHDRRKAEEAWA